MNAAKILTLATIGLSIFTVAVGPGWSQTKKSVYLWPDGAPGAKGTSYRDKPELIISIPKECNSTAIVILPGGGYTALAMDHEGKEIAKWFNQLGIATFICDYRHRGKGYGHPAPKDDAQRAIKMVRANAKEWGINPQRIGVIGFSAGGHLATTVSNHYKQNKADEANKVDETDKIARQSSRPDFAILCYPVIALGQKHTNVGSQNNLLGKNADEKLVKLYSNEKHVHKNTPPTFLWSTADDQAVKVENSLQYFAALRKHKVPAALHVFPKGNHGMGMAKNDKEVSQWTKLCEQWLKSQGFLESEKTNSPPADKSKRR